MPRDEPARTRRRRRGSRSGSRWLPHASSSFCLLALLFVLASACFTVSLQQSELSATLHAPPTLAGKVAELAGDDAAAAHQPPPDAEHQRQQQKPQKATMYSDGSENDDDDTASSPPPPPPPLPASSSSSSSSPSLFTVLLLSALMAACSGLGALPYLFFSKPLPDKLRGLAAAAACGVMLAVSFDLIHEGEKAGRSRGGGGNGNSNDSNSSSGWFPTTVGVFFGALFIRAAQGWLARHETVKWASLGGRRRSSGRGGLAPTDPLAPSSDFPSSSSSSLLSQQKNQRKNFLFVAVMAAHALGEGSGVGVSFAGERGWSRGVLTTLAIALHNVPEGLATATALASRGVSPKDALYWTLVTAAPQPLVAVPAFVFVDAFRGSALLPGALGFAAGCMVWLVAGELLPDALEAGAAPESVATVVVLSAAALEALRMWMALWEREDGSLAPPMMGSKGSGGGGSLASSSSSSKLAPPKSPFATSYVPHAAAAPLTFTAALASVLAAAAAGAGAGAAVADATPAGAATLGLASGALAWASSATLFVLLTSSNASSSSSSSSHFSVLVAAALGSALVAAATSAQIGGPAAARAVSAFQEQARLRRRSRNSFGADGFASHLAAPVASASAFASVSSSDESSFLPTKAAQGGEHGNGGGNGDSSSFFKRGGPPPPAAVAAAAGCICLAMHEAALAWSGRGNGSGSGTPTLVAAAALAAARAAFVGGATATMSSLVSGRDKSSRAWAAGVIAAVGPLVRLAAAVLKGGGKTTKTSSSSTLPLAFTAGALLSSTLLLLFPVAASAAGPRVARRTATFGVFAGVVGSVGVMVVRVVVVGGGG